MKFPEKESSVLEFKSDFPKNDQILKTVIGFCNQNGGKLIIGIEDDGTIVGLSHEKIQKALEYLEKSIFEASFPHIVASIYLQNISDKTVLIIQISEGMNKPYYVSKEGLEKGTYIRLGRSTLRATQDIIEELKWQSRGKSYDSMPVYQAKLTDLDLKSFENFLKNNKGLKNQEATIEILKSYYLVVEEHAVAYPTVAGILLFGKDPQKFFSEAVTMCSHFKGISGRDALAAKICQGTIINQLQQAMAFLKGQLNYSFKIEGMTRTEELEIPEIALREILINAIAHRNYHINAPTKIAIFENRVEIFSPGSFPGPMNTQNLRMGLTYIRNKAITKILYEMQLIEKLGTGFITLFESYEKRNLASPEIIELENAVKCILPRSIQKKDLSDDMTHEILQVFNLVTEVTISDIMKQLGFSRATVGRKISELVEKGILKRVGSGRSSRYIRL